MRLNLSITAKANKRLNELMNNENLDFTSKSDVIRCSLSLLDFFVKEEEKGNTVSITKDGEIIKDVVMHV